MKLLHWVRSCFRKQQRCELCEKRADALIVARKHWLCLECANAFAVPLEVGPREIAQIESDLEAARRTR